MNELTVKAAITAVLASELERDPDLLLLGETIRDGGAAQVTAGLHARFGERRVLETPVSENAIFGAALGLALSGIPSVVEIYSADFLFAVANEVCNDIPKWRQQQHRPGPLPICIRGCMGANGGLGPEHSQSMESYLFHTPGLRIVTPSTPADAAGLLRASIRDGEPVVYLEHRRVYPVTGPVPADPDHTVALGTANVVRQGMDLTIVAWAWMRHEAERAAALLASRGIEAEIVDPRTIRPFDWDTVLASAARTGRVLVAEEAPLTGSVGAEILARCLEELGPRVRARRVAMPDAIHPYHAGLEAQILPDAERIAAAAQALFEERTHARV